MDFRNYRRLYLLLIIFLLSGILYMLSFESVTDIRGDTPSFVFPRKYNFGDFLRSYEGTKITFPRPNELFNGTSLKLHIPNSSNGSQHKFLASSKPSDRYVINVSDIGPQRKVEEFFIGVGKLSCFKNGLNMSAVRARSRASLNRLKKCPCLENYHGSQCSIPGCVYKVPKNKILPFRLLTNARRVVMAIVVNHELEMTEIRIRMLDNVVDVFIIAESNITAGGETKPLYFFEAFKAGYLEEFQHKILYVYQDRFPPGYVENGWQADDYIRTYMSQHGMPRIAGLAPEDLFLNFDADEIPKVEAITFLKLHWGFQQPIRD